MKVSGSATLQAGRDEVWRALNDPEVLVRTIPGCQRLEEIDADSYAMTVLAGVASVKGVYQGEVRLTDQQQPDSFVLRARGAGAPGTVSADVVVRLSEDGAGATMLTYDADAIVGGMIGGVGQRMLGGVAKKTAGEFFGNVDAVLTGAAPAAPAPAEAPAAASTAPRTFEAPGAALALARGAGGGFAGGVAAGAGAALLGVLVGAWLSNRRGD